MFFLTAVKAQENNTPRLNMISRVQQNQILLRWAASDAVAWQKTNSGGFILEKYLFSKDGTRLDQPELLWSKSIQADPLEAWQSIVQNNDYAAIIAQALYGESFAVEGSQGELMDIVSTIQELEQRFSMALLAADMNFEAAQKAGWGYLDLELKENERYAYRIKSALPQEQLAIESSTLLGGLGDYEPLPAPIDLQGVFGDKKAILTWEYELFKSIYTYYSLERSEDNINFIPLSKEPLINLNDKPGAPAKSMYYIDSLGQNNKTYYYRIQGISPFGEPGQYSDTIAGQGQSALAYTPRIYDVEFTQNPNEVRLQWEYPKEGEASLNYFQLKRSLKDSGPYELVADSILATDRDYLFKDLAPSNYFKITAVGKVTSQTKTSFSSLVQREDSTPPSVPEQLTGKIDTLGIVKLKWKMNSEIDFLGYRVFRGFNEQEEPFQLTVTPITDSRFIDTVQVKNLNAKVYYQVVAVDKRFNNSNKSEVLVLDKPDVIPPTAPVFSKYEIDPNGVQLNWIPSSEEQAIHVLSRKNLSDDTDWIEVFKTSDTLTSFTDTEIKPNLKYHYSIKAIDESGLESLPSSPVTIEIVGVRLPEVIKDIGYNLSRENNYIELFWRVDESNVAEYTVYKQINDQDPSTWRIVPSNIQRVVDEALYPNQTYTYHIRAILTSGKFSQLSSVVIKF